MTGDRGQGTGDSRPGESTPADRPPLPAAQLLPHLLVVVLVVPLFAHGCHRGDHDDEPAQSPPVRHHEPRWGNRPICHPDVTDTAAGWRPRGRVGYTDGVPPPSAPVTP